MPMAREKCAQFIGSAIGLSFGGVWSVLGSKALVHGWQLPAAAAGIALTLVLIVRQWRAPLATGAGTTLFLSRYYIVAVVLELIAMNLAAYILPRLGLTDYLLTAVGVIVGLHFIGLWMATRMSRFLWIAGAMVTASVLAALLPAAVPDLFNARNATTGFTNAMILWVGASLAL